MDSSGKVMLKSLKKSILGCIPLSGFLYCMLQLTKHTSLPAKFKSEDCKWWNLYFCDKDEDQEALSFTIRILEILITGCGMEKKTECMSYGKCFKNCFKVLQEFIII